MIFKFTTGCQRTKNGLFYTNVLFDVILKVSQSGKDGLLVVYGP